MFAFHFVKKLNKSIEYVLRIYFDKNKYPLASPLPASSKCFQSKFLKPSHQSGLLSCHLQIDCNLIVVAKFGYAYAFLV